MIVFCMDPVGTFTAWTMKVMPKRAMMTVTTADSKYSRQTDFGGPVGFVSGAVDGSCPFLLKTLEKADLFGLTLVSEMLVAGGPLERLLVIVKTS
jgi:hypothetical protein